MLIHMYTANEINSVSTIMGTVIPPTVLSTMAERLKTYGERYTICTYGGMALDSTTINMPSSKFLM